MNQRRDSDIIEDYKDGAEVDELARGYGISPRRIQQILKLQGIELRPRTPFQEREPISKTHERLGLILTNYLFDRQIQANDLANDLGWGFRKLQRVQQGGYALELMDLQDIILYFRQNKEEGIVTKIVAMVVGNV